MKKKTKKLRSLLALFLISLCSVSQAQTCDELYSQARAAHKRGEYERAISMYQRAMSCDPGYRRDCQSFIADCRKLMGGTLVVSESEAFIPYQGGDHEVSVQASGSWTVEGAGADWCHYDAEKKRLVVRCPEANNSTREKITTLTVRSGNLFRTLRVVQAARPEYLEVSSKSLSFPSKGSEEEVTVETNARWEVQSKPAWCEVERDTAVIRIIVDDNPQTVARSGSIIITRPQGSVTIRVYQNAGAEQLMLSRDNINAGQKGGEYFVRVYANTDDWEIEAGPQWCYVQRMGDSIRVRVAKNYPNGQTREENLQIRAGAKMVSLNIFQEALLPQDIIMPEDRTIGGRRLSFGVTAGYVQPFVSASAGGDYMGSPVNYGLGTHQENASYGSETGFHFGAHADFRLFRNIYLTAGLEYKHFHYTNNFSGESTFYVFGGSSKYFRGSAEHSYREAYNLDVLEIPITASYRFKMGPTSHLSLNFGPYLQFGLSAKMKLSGNTDSETLFALDAQTHQITDSHPYIYHSVFKTEMNLYDKQVAWNEGSSTSGPYVEIPYKKSFDAAPLKRFNCGLQMGVAYEISGLSLGLSYNLMLTNMANKKYWEGERWNLLHQNIDTNMSGYKQRIHALSLNIAYTFRYHNKKDKD